MTKIKTAVIFSVLMTSASPLAAQKQSGQTVRKYDPSEIVCESIPVLGTRLAKKRTCATRAEWAERKRLDRLQLDVDQKNVCVKGAEVC